MISTFKNSLLLTIAGCFVAMSASAKTTPITYKNNELRVPFSDGLTVSDGQGSTTCSAKGYYDSKQTGATCKDTYILGGVHCYDCSCDENKYLVNASDCQQTGLKTDGDHCTLSAISETGKAAVDRYEGCQCDTSSGYLSANEFVTGVTTDSAFVYNGDTPVIKNIKGEELDICYKLDAFSCAGDGQRLDPSKLQDVTSDSSGHVNEAHMSDEPFYVKYRGKSNLKRVGSGDELICTTGVSFIEPLYATKPSNLTCAEFITTPGIAKYWKNTAYWYYSGDCSQNENCLGTSNNYQCAMTESEEFDWYDPAYVDSDGRKTGKKSQTCYKATGCSIGKDSRVNYACLGEATSTPTNLSSFNYTDVSVGNFSCRQVKGCASGYTQVYLGEYSSQSNIDSTVANNKSNVTGTFDVQSISTTNPSTNKLATAICKKQTGCNDNNGYYNVSSDSDCSWLRYFVKN